MITFPCPHCSHKLNIKNEAAGRKGKCSRCGQSIQVPAKSSLTRSPKAQTAEQAEGRRFPLAIVAAVLVAVIGLGSVLGVMVYRHSTKPKRGGDQIVEVQQEPAAASNVATEVPDRIKLLPADASGANQSIPGQMQSPNARPEGRTGADPSIKAPSESVPALDVQAAQEAQRQKEQKLRADFDRLLSQAREHAGAKRYAEAIQVYNEALQLVPSDAAAMKLLAEAKQALETDIAQEAERQIEQKRRADFDKLVAQAKEQAGAKRYADAVRLYDQALQLVHGDAAAMKARSEAKRALEAQLAEDKTKPLEFPKDSIKPMGEMLASGSYDRTVKLWNVASGKCTATLEGHTGWIWSVSISPDSKMLASASVDGTIKLWDVASGKNTATLRSVGEFRNVTFSPDGKTLASAGQDGTIKLWDVATGKNTARLEGPTVTVFALAYSPDGKILASGSADSTIKLWDTAHGKNVATLRGHTNMVRSTAFSPDGTTLASGSNDKTIKLWNLATGKNTATFGGNPEWVQCVAFSPDGKTLASASKSYWSEEIKLWDVASGKSTLLQSYSGPHHDTIARAMRACVAFSPDGKTLVSGGPDMTIKLWDVTTAKNTATLQGHTGGVESLVFYRQGKTPQLQPEQNPRANFDKLMAQAQEQATAKRYADAIRLYDEALKLVPGDPAAMKGLDEAKRALEAQLPDTKKTAPEEPKEPAKPVGRILAAGGAGGTMLIDSATGKMIAGLGGHRQSVLSIAYSPDGKTLASASADKTIQLWDAATGKNTATLTGHTGQVTCVVFSPNGKILASSGIDFTIRLWDAVSGKNTATLGGKTIQIGGAIAFSPDGRFLASAGGPGGIGTEKGAIIGGDTAVRLWDVTTGKNVAIFAGHKTRTSLVVWSPDGKTLASVGQETVNTATGSIRLWDVATGRNIRTLQGSRVSYLVYTSDGKTMISGHTDGSIKLWDPASGRNIATYGEASREYELSGLALSPDGKTLATAMNASIKLWDMASGKKTATFDTFPGGNPFFCLAFSPDVKPAAEDAPRPQGQKPRDDLDKLMAQAQEQASAKRYAEAVRLYGEALQLVPGDAAAMKGLSEAKQALEARLPETKKKTPEETKEVTKAIGHILASGSYDGTIKLWDTATGKSIATLQKQTGRIYTVTYSPDGKTLAAGCHNHMIELWDVASGKNIATLQAPAGIYTVAYSRDGKMLASGGKEQAIRLWDVASGKNVATIQGHCPTVLCVAFSPDGKTLASAGDATDGTIRLWDVATGRNTGTLKAHPLMVWSVAYSPDGRTLASAGGDTTIKLWDMATGRNIATLQANVIGLCSVVFSPDGKTLASAGRDKSIRVWDVASGRNVATLQGHSEVANSLAYSPDGKTLASVGRDKTIKLWDVVSGRNTATFQADNPSALSALAFSPLGKTPATVTDKPAVPFEMARPPDPPRE